MMEVHNAQDIINIHHSIQTYEIDNHKKYDKERSKIATCRILEFDTENILKHDEPNLRICGNE